METNFSKIKATGKLLSSKQISCEELTKQYLVSIEKENKVLNAYVKVTEEQALETAKKVDEKIMRGESLLPLEGIPMSLKDNISTKEIETTCPSHNQLIRNLLFITSKKNIMLTQKMEYIIKKQPEKNFFRTYPHNL